MRCFVSVLFFLLTLTGCQGGTLLVQAVSSSEHGSDYGGDLSTAVQIPMPSGMAILCTQGAGGTYSHNTPATYYDLDLDTSNTEDQEVYAPVSGMIYVHTESNIANFGYHVNIDLGDGTYIILAHMKTIVVPNKSEIAAGSLIGYEGCTGSCTGDHIHLGRHTGDASLMGQYGTSIPISLYTKDTRDTSEDATVYSSPDVICGDNGHSYTSFLPVPLWHPDGTLVKTVGDPKVYLLEESQKQWIQNEDIFRSYGYDFDNVVYVSDEELACYGNGSSLSTFSAVAAAYDPNGILWLSIGSSSDAWRYRIHVQSTEWTSVLASWGLSYTTTHLPPVKFSTDPFFTDWPIREGTAIFRDGSLLKEASRSDVYVVSGQTALPIKNWDSYLFLGFFTHTIFSLSDGSVVAIHPMVGSCQAGNWCVSEELGATCGGTIDLTGGDISTATTSGVDHDGDGHDSEATGGDDCWDYNLDVYPGAVEICGDGIDQDCSGTDLSCSPDKMDTDGDGVADADDNCLYHDNASQQDQEGDGIGDACDPDFDPYGTSSPTPEPDVSPTPVSSNGDGCDCSCSHSPTPISSSTPTPTPTPTSTPVPSSTPTPTPVPSPTPVPTPVPTDVGCGCSSGDVVCIANCDATGVQESLCFSKINFSSKEVYQNSDDYAVGYGLFDWNISSTDRVKVGEGNYVCVNFTSLSDGDAQLTLISSVGKNGTSPVNPSDMSDWVWWQNYDLCTSHTTLSDQFCVSQGGWNYLLGVHWSKTNGLTPAGDGT